MTRKRPHTRTAVEFLSDGTRCDAWLYQPAHSSGGSLAPIVVMAHGLGATKKMGLDGYAERFAAAGYVCLVFDYRHLGASAGEPRQLLSIPGQIADWEAAIEYARTLPGIDPERVVSWGTSLGGGHSLSMAARDHRLAAAIAQCPFTDGLASSMAVDRLTGVKVMATAARDRGRSARGVDPIYLPIAAAPGSPSFMSAPDALPGMIAIAEDADDFDNRLTARSAIDILRYAPGRQAVDITCPIYVALCDPDTVAPNKTAERQVSRAANAEVHTYPVGHFDIYVGDAFEQAVTDYIDFLNRHVPVGA